MNTKDKGTITEAKCLAYLTSIADEVLVPFGDRMPYDLVYVLNNRFIRVQCKYSSGLTKHNSYEVNLTMTGGNQSNKTIKKYKDDDFDYLFVNTPDASYFIPWSECSKRSITVSLTNKWSKYIV